MDNQIRLGLIGAMLLLSILSVVAPVSAISSTTTSVACNPSTLLSVTQQTQCTATLSVTPTAGTEVIAFSSTGQGFFSSSTCNIYGTTTCYVYYTPESATVGLPIVITAAYAGDASYYGSQGTTTLQVITTNLLGLQEGFDGYAAAAATISPWSFTYTPANTCWSTYPNSGVTTYGSSAQSQPNAYIFKGIKHACNATTNTNALSILVNSTSPNIQTNFYVNLEASNLTSSKAAFKVLVDASLVYSVDVSTLSNVWTPISGQVSIAVTAGTTHTVTYEVVTTTGGSTFGFTLALDSISIYGGTSVNPGSNVNLRDASSGLPFSPASFQTVTVSSYYSSAISCPTMQNTPFSPYTESPIYMGTPPMILSQSGNACILTNVQSPTLVIPQLRLLSTSATSTSPPYSVSGEISVTVAAGQTDAAGNSIAYTRTIIPCLDPVAGTSSSCNSLNIYLDNPLNIVNYQLQLVDYTNTFSTGSRIFIYAGTQLITSGYVDSTALFPAALEPNHYYTVWVLTPDGSKSAETQLQTTLTSSQLTLTIANIPTNTLNSSNQIQVGAGWLCNNLGIATQYYDSGSQTTAVQFKLIYVNMTGTYTIGTSPTQFATGFFGTVQYQFTNANTGQNLAPLINGLSVTALGTVNSNVVPQTGIPINNLVQSGCTGPSIFNGGGLNIPSSILGLSAIVSSPNAWENLISLGIILVTVAIFGARSSTFGVAFMVFELLILSEAGWVSLRSDIIYLILGIALLFILARRMKRVSI